MCDGTSSYRSGDNRLNIPQTCSLCHFVDFVNNCLLLFVTIRHIMLPTLYVVSDLTLITRTIIFSSKRTRSHDSSPGLDNIPHWFYWACLVEITDTVTHISNLSFDSRYYGMAPKQCVDAIVTPVPKVVKSDLLTDYRHISVRRAYTPAIKIGGKVGNKERALSDNFIENARWSVWLPPNWLYHFCSNRFTSSCNACMSVALMFDVLWRILIKHLTYLVILYCLVNLISWIYQTVP